MANSDEMEKALEGIGEYKYGFSDPDTAVYRSKRGFTREIVEEISHQKNEPDWMRKLRLKAYEHAIKRPIPTWGGDLSGLNLEDMYYYVRPSEKTQGNWEDVPDAIKNTFDKLGIPEAERKFLAGVGACAAVREAGDGWNGPCRWPGAQRCPGSPLHRRSRLHPPP